MRWRFFAARVCATETDSTKPMIEIRIAGPISCPRDRAKRRHGQRRQALRHVSDNGERLRFQPEIEAQATRL
jgi:hypothetical protein